MRSSWLDAISALSGNVLASLTVSEFDDLVQNAVGDCVLRHQRQFDRLVVPTSEDSNDIIRGIKTSISSGNVVCDYHIGAFIAKLLSRVLKNVFCRGGKTNNESSITPIARDLRKNIWRSL